jgi:hypothetical protein
VRRLLLLCACLVAVGGAGCGGSSAATKSAARPAASAVRDLHSVAELRSVFEAHRGEPRLIVLVSPT